MALCTWRDPCIPVTGRWQPPSQCPIWHSSPAKRCPHHPFICVPCPSLYPNVLFFSYMSPKTAVSHLTLIPCLDASLPSILMCPMLSLLFGRRTLYSIRHTWYAGLASNKGQKVNFLNGNRAWVDEGVNHSNNICYSLPRNQLRRSALCAVGVNLALSSPYPPQECHSHICLSTSAHHQWNPS